MWRLRQHTGKLENIPIDDGFYDPGLSNVTLDEFGRPPGINPDGLLGGLDLRTSDSGIGFIKSWEKGPGGAAALGQYSSPEGGTDTVGWGHKIQPGENFSGGLTAAQADQQFSNDLASHQKLVQDNVTVPLSQQQFDALTSLAYNYPKALKPNSVLLGMLNNYDYSGAADQLFGLNHVGTTVSPGLPIRRGDEWNMFANGVYRITNRPIFGVDRRSRSVCSRPFW